MPFVPYDLSSAQAAPAFTLGAPRTSGGLSLATLRARLLKELATRTDITSADADFFLNEAYRLMAQELDLQTFDASLVITLAVGQPFYLIPEQVDFIKDDAAVQDASEYPRGGKVLVFSGLDQYRKLADQTGRINRLYRQGNMIVVYPTPTQAETLVLNVKFLPDKLTLDTHVPLFAEKYHYALVLKAKAMALASVRDMIASNDALNQYVVFLRATSDTRAEERANQRSGFYIPRREEDLAEYNPEIYDAL